VTTSEEEIHFDSDLHRYTVGGVVLPSVTQVIESVLPSNFGPMTDEREEWIKGRGTALHAACKLLSQGRLDWESVSPEIMGKALAWKRFLSDAPLEILGCELAMAHPLYRYCGMMDLVQYAPTASIIDIKSTISPQLIIQLGGYSLLWSSKNGKIRSAAGVELRDDETYRCQWFDQREIRRGEQTFLAALTLFNFKKENNL
jgi:hypothetical protein